MADKLFLNRCVMNLLMFFCFYVCYTNRVGFHGAYTVPSEAVGVHQPVKSTTLWTPYIGNECSKEIGSGETQEDGRRSALLCLLILCHRTCTFISLDPNRMERLIRGIVKLRELQSTSLVGSTLGKKGWNNRNMESNKQKEIVKIWNIKSRYGKTSSISTEWAETSIRSTMLANISSTSFQSFIDSKTFHINKDSRAEEKDDEGQGKTKNKKNTRTKLNTSMGTEGSMGIEVAKEGLLMNN